MINKKYLTRAVIWTLLITGLTILTFYNRIFFIKPIEDEIDKLALEESNTENLIKNMSTQLNQFNNINFNINDIELMVPTTLDFEEIQQKYVLRPVFLSGATTYDFTITDEAPKNIKLGTDIGTKKVTLNMTITDIEQFYNFMDEMYASKRSVYFGNFSYKLQGEVLPGKKPSSETINIKVEYYLFYYKK